MCSYWIGLLRLTKLISPTIVPSRAPRLLQVSAKTSDTVYVRWEPIPQQHVKGILQGYHVHYSKEDTRYPVIKNIITVNASVTHATLDNMKPVTRYHVWIAGFTRKGPGPSSEKEFVTTPQAGECGSFMLLHLPSLQIHLPDHAYSKLGRTE